MKITHKLSQTCWNQKVGRKDEEISAYESEQLIQKIGQTLTSWSQRTSRFLTLFRPLKGTGSLETESCCWLRITLPFFPFEQVFKGWSDLFSQIKHSFDNWLLLVWKAGAYFLLPLGFSLLHAPKLEFNCNTWECMQPLPQWQVLVVFPLIFILLRFIILLT